MIQLQVLNYILQNKDSSIVTLNNLKEEHFSDYQNEFNFILNHIQKYDSIPDQESFLDTFPNFEIINVQEDPRYLLEELYKDRNERYLASTFNQIRSLLMSNKIDDAMEIYKKSAETLSEHVSLRSVDILEDLSRFNDYVQRTQDFNKYYIKTGFRELDEIIGGWDKEEELATVIARTNVGKSFVLIRMALEAVKQGLNVGLYSGEMSEKKVGYRFDTFVSNISNGALVHGNESVLNEYKKYIEELPTYFKGHLRVLTPVMINGPAGVSALRSFIEKDKLDILFVDQHSLLEDDRKAKNPIEKAANISRDLKNLQVMKKIPIITVSQMNRTKNEDTDMIDTRQVAASDRISQDSTIIIGLARDNKDSSVMHMQIVKSRDSINGVDIVYKTDLNRGIFEYMPDEDTPACCTASSEELHSRYMDLSNHTSSNDGEIVFED